MSYQTWIDDPGLDLRDVISIVWGRRWWVISAVVLFTAIGVAAGLLLPRVYRATVVLASTAADRNGISGDIGAALGNLGGLASVVGLHSSEDAQTEEALAVLQSRQLTDAFIQSKNLLPVLFDKQWDAAESRWKHGRPPTAGMAYKRFDQIRKVEKEKKNATLYKLSVEWRNREQAADWANTLVEYVNGEMRSRAIHDSDAMLRYLEKELSTTTVLETRQAINRLIEGRIKQRMLANVTQEYAFRVVDKAVIADADDPIWPRRRLLAIAGVLAGVILGAGGALLVEAVGNGARRMKSA